MARNRRTRMVGFRVPNLLGDVNETVLYRQKI